MPLNILKHKSWNVYNKSNIERVWRDEMLAKKKEEEEEMRVRQADAERRLKILRERSELRRNMTEDGEKWIKKDDLDNFSAEDEHMGYINADSLFSKNEKKRKENDIMLDRELKKKRELLPNKKHINFWEDLESGKVSVDYRNPEYEKERLDTDRKWKDVVSMRLSNSAKEMSPWYSHFSLQSSIQRQKDHQSLEKEMKIQNSIKDFNDPLTIMQTCLKQKKKIKELELNKKKMPYSPSSCRVLEGKYESSSKRQKDYRDINEDIKMLKESRFPEKYEINADPRISNKPSMYYATDYKIVGKYSSQYNPEYVKKHG
ncbi:hypothetical protein PORY_002369 [Pneumocystis oryctolagi]|uniref:Uncharacterized protein n=1 Tax=Pneumocystis oryctolagi TaxID=42067 RepID=A0ACB7CB83_9ASCO|nr:hypothetical protein PORY_002369 [Pneumocystis oryctolagi]